MTFPNGEASATWVTDVRFSVLERAHWIPEDFLSQAPPGRADGSRRGGGEKQGSDAGNAGESQHLDKSVIDGWQRACDPITNYRHCKHQYPRRTLAKFASNSWPWAQRQRTLVWLFRYTEARHVPPRSAAASCR